MTESIKKIILKENITYQEGSVVSKQIIKKANGNITLFAFDKNESLTEHTSPFEALIEILEGEMVVTIGGIANTIKAGEMIILPPDVPHALKAEQQVKMLLIMIK